MNKLLDTATIINPNKISVLLPILGKYRSAVDKKVISISQMFHNFCKYVNEPINHNKFSFKEFCQSILRTFLMTPVLIIGAIFAIIIPFISVKGAETKNADSSEDVPQSASYGRASSNNSLISQKDSPRPEYVTSDRSDAKNDQPSPTTASGASHGLDNSVTQKQPITSELPGPEHDFTRPAPNHAFEKLFQKFLNDAEPSKLQ